MKTVTVKAREFIPAGRVYVMPNTDHPEVDMWATIAEADHLIVACHVDDEQRVRDAIAVEQERPHWWREGQRLETLVAALRGEDDTP